MPQVGRLKDRRQFLALRNEGQKVVCSAFVLQYAPIEQLSAPVALEASDACAVGFTVTKKLGNAVKRNRIKRRLRAMVDELFPQHARAGYAYVVIGRWKAADVTFDALLQQGHQALQRIHHKNPAAAQKKDS